MIKIKKNSGFTLIELMVVVAIIGILASVAVPTFRKYASKAKTTEAKILLSQMKVFQEGNFSVWGYHTACLLNMTSDYTGRYTNWNIAITFTGNPVGEPVSEGCTAFQAKMPVLTTTVLPSSCSDPLQTSAQSETLSPTEGYCACVGAFLNESCRPDYWCYGSHTFTPSIGTYIIGGKNWTPDCKAKTMFHVHKGY
jgi:prepilin-type N-terminal cleavage/methylation domain-containing protein